MLTYLHVKNLALIKEAEITFENGLNVLSGETGAGKSILMGAILLCLGTRSESDLIRTGCEYAFAELEFSPDSEALTEALVEKGFLPEEGVYRFSRRVTEKKSVGKINGETVPLSVLREAASLFIEVYGQHELTTLFSEEEHLRILDSFGGDAMRELLTAYRDTYREFRKKNEIAKKLSEEAELDRKIEYLEYAIGELSAANLKPGELSSLRDRYRSLNEQIKSREAISEAESLLEGETEESVMTAERALLRLESTDPSIRELAKALSDAEAILSDVVSSLKKRLADDVATDDELGKIELRIDEISRFELKYGVSEENAGIKTEAMQKELDALLDLRKNKETVSGEIALLKERLIREGKRLSEERMIAAKKFDEKMRAQLADLNFPMVRFETRVEKTNRYTANGADSVVFFFSANPGEELKPLSKVASGGELSRIMLALKTLSADDTDRKTWLFDEIDTGISGGTAGSVGEKLKQISENNQVICISHLPQVVSASDHHFRIRKETDGASTETEVKLLSEEETVVEIARLVGNGEPTEAGIESARELRNRMKRKTK